MTYHIIGVGAIGSLIAAHLRKTIPAITNITLMVKKPQYTVRSGSFGPDMGISISRSGTMFTARGFKWEVVSTGHKGYDQSQGEGVEQSDMLRDLVFNSNGTVRSAF